MNKIAGFFLVVIVLVGCSDQRSKEGDLFFNQQKFQEAIEAYNDYLEARPNDLAIIYKRGRAYEELGDDKSALQDYNFIIGKDAENVDGHLSLGGYFYRTGDFGSALFHYEIAMVKDQGNAIGFLQKGKTNQKLGNLREALSDYNAAISINESAAEFYIARGSLRLVMNKNGQACNDFKIAQSLGSNDAAGIIKDYCR
jgi:tetratricopeptide (TPR) repeat protein